MPDKDILFRMQEVLFRTNFLSDPVDALTNLSGLDEETKKGAIEQIMQHDFMETVEAVAKGLDVDPTETIDKNTRTSMQQKSIELYGAKKTLARLKKYMKSRWMQALELTEGIPVKWHDTNEDNPLDLCTIVTLYFFALHDKDIDLESTEPLTNEQKNELQTLLNEIDSCFFEKNIQHEAIASYFVSLEAGKPVTVSPRKQAELENILLSVGQNQLSISNRDYQFALTTRKNATAYIASVDDDIFERLSFEDGKLSMLKSTVADVEIKKATVSGGMQTVKELDIALLRQIFTALYKEPCSVDASTVTVYLPSFCREMGIDIQKGNANDLFGKLAKFEKCVGVLGDGSYWKLLQVLGYDKEKNTLTVAAPYMNRILSDLQNIPPVKRGRIEYLQPVYNKLMHSRITSEKNKPAIEITNLIINGLLRRGKTPTAMLKQNRGKQITNTEKIIFRVPFASIVEDVPLLQARLENSSTTADRNKQLKRAFTGAYKLLHTRTDAFIYFIGLDIPEIIPTMTTLNDTLEITFTGINGDYRIP